MVGAGKGWGYVEEKIYHQRPPPGNGQNYQRAFFCFFFSRKISLFETKNQKTLQVLKEKYRYHTPNHAPVIRPLTHSVISNVSPTTLAILVFHFHIESIVASTYPLSLAQCLPSVTGDPARQRGRKGDRWQAAQVSLNAIAATR